MLELRDLLEPHRAAFATSPTPSPELFAEVESVIHGYGRVASDAVGFDVPAELTMAIASLRRTCLRGRTLTDGFRPRS